MATLETFDKQPAEIQDYDISFADYLRAVGESLFADHEVTATAEAGITLGTTTLVDGVAKVWVSGGTNDTKYRVTVTLTTAGGRVREADITIRVKEL